MKLKKDYSIKLRYFPENDDEPWLADLYYKDEPIIENGGIIHGHGATPDIAVLYAIQDFMLDDFVLDDEE